MSASSVMAESRSLNSLLNQADAVNAVHTISELLNMRQAIPCNFEVELINPLPRLLYLPFIEEDADTTIHSYSASPSACCLEAHSGKANQEDEFVSAPSEGVESNGDLNIANSCEGSSYMCESSSHVLDEGCERPLTESDPKRAQKIACAYEKCMWHGSEEQYTIHIEQCLYRPVTCLRDGCNWHGEFNMLRKHQAECRHTLRVGGSKSNADKENHSDDSWKKSRVSSDNVQSSWRTIPACGHTGGTQQCISMALEGHTGGMPETSSREPHKNRQESASSKEDLGSSRGSKSLASSQDAEKPKLRRSRRDYRLPPERPDRNGPKLIRVPCGPAYRLVPLPLHGQGEQTQGSTGESSSIIVAHETVPSQSQRGDLQPSIPDDLALEWALAASSEQGKAFSGDEICAICLEPLPLSSSDVVRLPNCEHRFHLICTVTMQLPADPKPSSGNAACAICRSPFSLSELHPNSPALEHTSNVRVAIARPPEPQQQQQGSSLEQQTLELGAETGDVTIAPIAAVASGNSLEQHKLAMAVCTSSSREEKANGGTTPSSVLWLKQGTVSQESDAKAGQSKWRAAKAASHRRIKLIKELFAEYQLHCKESINHLKEGMDFTLFSKLLNDESDAACSCSDEEIQKVLATMKERYAAHRRSMLVEDIFQECDKNSDGFLHMSEMLFFASQTGFDGNASDWAEEYSALCKECECDPIEGIDRGTFARLVNDTSDAGLHCSDQELQNVLAAIKQSPYCQ